MIVRLMNAALQDDSDMDEYGIAATLLPLSTVFGRRLTKGVIQFVYTLIQVCLPFLSSRSAKVTKINFNKKSISEQTNIQT